MVNSCVASITVLTAWPYGNAQEVKNADGTWTFTCQHGVNECNGNMWEACAIEHYGNNSITVGEPKWWPFYDCMEKSGQAGTASVAQNCANNNGLDWNTISTCATTSNPAKGSTTDGNPWMHNIAVRTNNLQPPHQYTPWVVLNGKPISSADYNLPLINLICAAYTGPLPSCCPKPVKFDYA
jgi:interferon gamma-inducible protein 30